MAQKRFIKLFFLGFVLVIFVVLVSGLTLSFLTCPRASKTAPAAVDFYSCEQNQDCIKTSGDCCDCNHGGTATAINKVFEKEWKDKLFNNCRAIGCIAVISNHPSCFQEPKCVNNKCVLEESKN